MNSLDKERWLTLNSRKLKREYARLEGNKGEDSLAGNIVSDTDDSSLGDAFVEDQSRLDLSGGETVARDVDYI